MRIHISAHRFLRSEACLLVLLSTSIIATVTGMTALMAFNATAGAEMASPAHWPIGTSLERSAPRLAFRQLPTSHSPDCLAFAHPFCSCTRAMLQELDTILAPRKLRDQPIVIILFSRTDSTWKPGDTWSRASKVANASPQWDQNGNEAKLFGARTSGLVLLYDAHGLLLFDGGITASRGHAGGNFGADRLAAALDSGHPSEEPPSRVFGCALFSRPG
jgi:hypothetical protein